MVRNHITEFVQIFVLSASLEFQLFEQTEWQFRKAPDRQLMKEKQGERNSCVQIVERNENQIVWVDIYLSCNLLYKFWVVVAELSTIASEC